MRSVLFLWASILFFGCTKTVTESCPVCANPLLDSSASVIVTSVADGDTFSFTERGEKIDVRVLVIDCFETRHGTRLTEQAQKAGISEDSALALGFRAKAVADSILYGKTVDIYRDTADDNFDVYGRLLRNVYFLQNNIKVNYADVMKGLGLTVP
jgi:endonuclease YncB( thermonuclease family)